MVSLPQCLSGKESVCNAGATGDSGSISGSGRSPGRGHGNPLQHPGLENPMDRGARQATVHSPQDHEELDTTDVTWHAHMHPRSLVMTSTLWWVDAMRFTFPGGELG